MQLLEVGFSEKLTNGSTRSHTARIKPKFHAISPKPNGYHITENGTETVSFANASLKWVIIYPATSCNVSLLNPVDGIHQLS